MRDKQERDDAIGLNLIKVGTNFQIDQSIVNDHNLHGYDLFKKIDDFEMIENLNENDFIANTKPNILKGSSEQ